MYMIETTCGMIESIKTFITKDEVKALMALEDVCKQALINGIGEVRQQ